MLRHASNKLIKYGFRTHRVGKRTRQVGLGIGAAGATAAGGLAATSYLGSGGHSVVLHPAFPETLGRVLAFSRVRQIPAVDYAIENYARPVGRFFGRQAAKAATWFGKSPRRVNLAQRLTAAGIRWQVPKRSVQALAIGAGAAAAGWGLEHAGQWMLQRGFQSHPRQLEKKARHFFGLRKKKA